ncbi:unnamed protein product [Parascedosporium putredinis]|uniref:Choloylglycine hydrolase/NAAA C-terminal domain-containing protein n=1 Tax=Parascedosporium putredinis TaxID=1442378 RepID=A0A9P1MCC8_9PEZI|nr:unnamed protein product [Parascedosporium putredinis]CAI8001339.1 unnamed protein product [Parascedosporium putredinis]
MDINIRLYVQRPGPFRFFSLPAKLVCSTLFSDFWSPLCHSPHPLIAKVSNMKSSCALSTLAAASMPWAALACSRVVYHAEVDDRIVIGRSMDFVQDTNTTIWAFPAGMKRNGAIEDNPVEWTSKYGSITALMYDIVYSEGLNTEGLTSSILYLGGSDYGERNSSEPGIFIGLWLQYVLDNYATVEETVNDLCSGEKIQVVKKAFLDGVNSVGHLIVTDKGGDNVIMEYIDGKLNCFHSSEYDVVTNEPTYPEQLAINTYWEPISNWTLPGSARPADRFARLSHYNQYVPGANDSETAVAYAAGMIRAVSDPMVPNEMIFAAGENDIWPTLWRTYIDVQSNDMYYESATSPMSFWWDVDAFDLGVGGPLRSLKVSGVPWQERMGEVTNAFVDTDEPPAVGHRKP